MQVKPNTIFNLGSNCGLITITNINIQADANPLGAIIGVGAGGLTTSVVAFVKAKLKAKASS